MARLQLIYGTFERLFPSHFEACFRFSYWAHQNDLARMVMSEYGPARSYHNMAYGLSMFVWRGRVLGDMSEFRRSKSKCGRRRLVSCGGLKNGWSKKSEFDDFALHLLLDSENAAGFAAASRIEEEDAVDHLVLADVRVTVDDDVHGIEGAPQAALDSDRGPEAVDYADLAPVDF